MIDLNFIKHWEGCRLTAYKPIPTDPWTIGYGATGPEIKQGTQWTQQQAEDDLAKRCSSLLHFIMLRLPNLSKNQYTALVSFCYNVGTGAFLGSTLFLKLKAGIRNMEIFDEFNKWNKSAGRVIPGLVNRRAAEARKFMESEV